MKYIWGIILFIGGFIGASASMGSLPSINKSNSYAIDYETATIEEQTAWLHNEANEVKRGIESALPKKSKGQTVGMRVKGTSVNVDQRRIDVELQMVSYGVLLMSQSEARKQFTKKTCPQYKRSQLGEANVILGITILDARGGMIIKFNNSKRFCERYS